MLLYSGCMNTREAAQFHADSIDKFVQRQQNKPQIKGVHESVMPKCDPGTSVAGAYIPGHGYGANTNTAKRLHSEKLQELKDMPAPKLIDNEG